jgi:hypothetical protein
MANKVSDFKIAESMLRKICKKYNVNFSDVFLSFDEKKDGCMFIGETKNIAHTIFKIISEYINRSFAITGVQFFPNEEDRENFLITIASNLRTFMYGDKFDSIVEDEPHVTSLYSYAFLWVLFKDIICPVYDKELKNIKIICVDSNQTDIAKYYDEEDIKGNEKFDKPFIFVNIINNRVVQGSFIFIEALKAYGLSPVEVIKNIYETDLYQKYQGLLEISLEEEEISDFECSVMANLGIYFYGFISKKLACIDPDFVKIAQNSVPGLPNQFWQLGVLEKMIEPTRGSDWSVYKGLEPYIKEFWDQVEKVRQKRIKKGHDDGVPFDLLLRIKSKQTVDYKADPTLTIQSLLSSDRVW